MSELEIQFGRCLRSARKDRGLTQADLAERINRSLDMVGRMERGEIAPSFETIERIIAALEIQPAELFGGTSSIPMPRSQKIRNALAVMETMPDGKLDQALSVLRAL